MTTQVIRSKRRGALWALGLSVLLASCSSTGKKQAEPGPDAPSGQGANGRLAVRMSDGSDRGSQEAGSRYITTLGLPSDMVIHYPDWIVNPGIEGILGAVGVATQSALGTREQIDEARLSARLELARMMEARVQAIGRGELEEHRRAEGDAADPTLDGAARRSRLGVERDITDVVLSGSRQRALWFDPLSRDCYVWIVMDGGVPGKADHTIENGVSIYVANRMIETEYRPERQPEQRVNEPVVIPLAPAPEPIKTPIQQLEEKLKPIATIPVGAQPPQP